MVFFKLYKEYILSCMHFPSNLYKRTAMTPSGCKCIGFIIWYAWYIYLKNRKKQVVLIVYSNSPSVSTNRIYHRAAKRIPPHEGNCYRKYNTRTACHIFYFYSNYEVLLPLICVTNRYQNLYAFLLFHLSTEAY